jgi:UDP-glucose 4-epimerase
MSESTHTIRRAVVTGAAGFIGSHLVARLAEAGTEVVGIDNERSGDWSRVQAPCERVERDLCDLGDDELRGLLGDADVVFHLAAEKYNSSRSTPQRVIDVNISATHRLFDAAGREGVGRIVFTSSLYAYGTLGPAAMDEVDVPTPTTMYGMSKVAGEDMLRVAERDHGVSWAVARLFFVYGPRQYAEGGYKSVIVTNFERILRGEAPVVFGDGLQALDYVYVDDVVDALVRMGRDRRRYLVNLGSGRAVTVAELTERMLRVSGSDLRPVTGLVDWTAGTSRWGRVGRARETIGWTAGVDLDEGLGRVWRWMSGGAGG